MIELKKVKFEEKELFWNINQKYLYEMTKYYPDEIDENGNYHYGYFDDYFTDAKRSAFFITCNNKICGFIMINNYSYIGHNPNFVIAEFTIFPSYRRKHYAIDVIKQIFDLYHGKWEIKYNEKNIPAKNLWHKVTKEYNPKIYFLNEQETVLEFNN